MADYNVLKKKTAFFAVLVCFIFCVMTNITVSEVCADYADIAISARINTLYRKIGNTYFNGSHTYSACG
ncbi:MAG: hypothetical protein IJI39_03005 [Clostridia bacterium]|nr:hypothetical protein [Clostridia bacterium]